jgi:hypothetical protein
LIEYGQMTHRNSFWLPIVLIWGMYGTLILTLGAIFILKSGQALNAAGLGAFIGGSIGFVVAALVSVAARLWRSPKLWIWGLAGSMVGAGVAIALLRLGGFPQGTQADLSLIFLGPGCLALGAIGGSIAGLGIWRIFRKT